MNKQKMVGTKEFYELMDQFEKDVKKIIYGHKIKRENIKDVPAGVFYTDGYVNTMFQSYMHGYQNAKCLARIGAI